jgi:hypothetical protein
MGAELTDRDLLTEGEKYIEAGDARAAIECARQGLDSLGDDYVEPGEEDDTGQKVLAAEDLIERGREEDGARLLLRMLRARSEMRARPNPTKQAEGA